LNAAVFFLGASVLAHEVCLLRALSLAYWHHAASLVVSVALLGFGLAGTLLALVPRLKREATVFVAAALYAVLIPASLRAAARIDFNVLEVGWNPQQWWRLAALQGVFLLPFLCAATGIIVALALRAERPGPTYGYNLLGSGVGALAAPLLLAQRAPHDALGIVAVVAALGCVVRFRFVGVVAGAIALLLGGHGLEMSPYKAWPSTPGKSDVRTEYGVLGRVDSAVVPSMHFAPGLSLMADRVPEDQVGLYVDGHLVAARDRGDSAYLDRTVGALPFALLEKDDPRVLLLGVGPDLARADELVETNAALAALSGVRESTVAEPRAFLESTARHWDLILHHVVSLHPAAEAPLLTIEGIGAALDRAGAVAISCALSMPPRGGLRLLRTADAVTKNVIAVRSADRLCVLLLHRAPTPADRRAVERFCHDNSFDPVRPEEWRFAEPYHLTDVPLRDPGRGYPYDLRPATDARPYFFKFFKWSRLGDSFDPDATPFVQWPYVALVVAFCQVTLFAVLLMAGPLAISRAARAPAAVFLALGLGFMLVEMAFLQHAMVRLGSPVHAAAAVLGGFLVGSGAGSLVVERLGYPTRRAALAVVFLAPLAWVLLPTSLPAAALLCAIVAFPMGMPFPSALSRLEARSTPWALAFNGCASVAAAAAAPLVSSSISIPATGLFALAAYAFVAARRR